MFYTLGELRIYGLLRKLFFEVSQQRQTYFMSFFLYLQQAYLEPDCTERTDTGERTTVFQAEVAAILQDSTTEEVKKGHEKQILFYPDSQANLKDILRPRANLALVHE